MCLILVAWQAHPKFPLVVAANRDEFHARPAREASRWAEDPRILGGRDLEAGGAWLGLGEDGRFAAVTNVREPGVPKGPRSRGELPRDYLLGVQPPGVFADSIDRGAYSGFNLLLADAESLWYVSNRDDGARPLKPGVYGVSNHLLDTPWPKLESAKERFALALPELPSMEGLFGILADREIVSDHRLPATGVSLDWERLLSAVFVVSEGYGTRASTVATRSREGRLRLEERRFGPGGQAMGISSFLV